jgi:DNA primase
MHIITLKQKKDLIVSIFGEGSTSGDGKDIAVFCPICKKSPKAKKKRKLSIAIDTGVYHCWVCEAKGKSLAKLIKYEIPNFKDLEKVREYFGSEIVEGEEAEEIIKISLPEDFRLVVLDNNRASRLIKKYLLNRGMTEEDLYRFKVGYSEEFGFDNRAIFPSFDENLDLNFFVTRSVDEKVKFAKYRNCDASKKDIIFNEHLINWKKPVILVEGIFDAVKAGHNSIPVLGSWIDMNHQVFKKLIINQSDVLLGFDPDAQDKEMKIAKNLFQQGLNVKIIQNKDKDLGDLTHEEVKNLIQNAKPFDNIERMRYLIGGIRSGSIY